MFELETVHPEPLFSLICITNPYVRCNQKPLAGIPEDINSSIVPLEPGKIILKRKIIYITILSKILDIYNNPI